MKALNKRFQRTAHKVRRPLNRDVGIKNMKLKIFAMFVLCVVPNLIWASEPPSTPDSTGHSIEVRGAVNLPGPQCIPPKQVRTVYEAIIHAQGFSSNADSNRVRLIQGNSKGNPEVKIIDIGTMMKTLNFINDTYVYPGDIIEVPQKE